MSDSLRGKKVLVTRPAAQAEHLCDLVAQVGGVPIRLPALDILPIEDRSRFDAVCSRLDDYAIAIFVSRNAVAFALPLLGDRLHALARLRLVATGPGTADALRAAGLPSVIHGGTQADSEALLNLTELQEDAARNRRVVIFRGTDGRELLADTLRARGARIDYAEVYRRVTPRYEKLLLDKIWLTDKPDLMVVTSTEALRNLFAILGPEHRVIMLDTPLVVIGERLAGLARELGFGRQAVIVAAPGDEELMRVILQNFRV
ncbi:MAG: uroporphyrinogen-III synthase [Gammaproteobacteria bacterium]